MYRKSSCTLNLLIVVATLVIQWPLVACPILQPLDTLGELRENRAKWEAASIDDYAYQFQIVCFCPFSEIPIDIEVRNSVPISIREITSDKTKLEKFFKPYSTIENLFNAIQQEIEANAELGSDEMIVSSDFDRIYGFPRYFEIAYTKPSSDANITYLIHNFKVLE